VFRIGVASTFVNKKKKTDIRTVPNAARMAPALLLVSPITNKNITKKNIRNTAESAFIDFTPA
jgi:hypothetical protein